MVHTPCGNHWSQYNGHCYRHYQAEKNSTWFNAQRVCKAHKGSLVIYETASEEDFVISTYLQETGSHKSNGRLHPFWIGLSDILEGGDFVWSNKKRLTETGYSKWKQGAPVTLYKGKLEYCVYTEVRVDVYHWVDLPCSNDLRLDLGFVCEKRYLAWTYNMIMTGSRIVSICCLSYGKCQHDIKMRKQLSQHNNTSQYSAVKWLVCNLMSATR